MLGDPNAIIKEKSILKPGVAARTRTLNSVQPRAKGLPGVETSLATEYVLGPA